MEKTSSSSSSQWLKSTKQGLYCVPGGFYIDPVQPVDKALITHGHTDHARPNNRAVLATPETLAIMKARYPSDAAKTQSIDYHQPLAINSVSVTYLPAGHVLGSAQILLTYKSERIIVSGDYKRRRDPTCKPFDVQPCNIFVTEATFGLPVFRHPPDTTQISKLLSTLALYPERCILLGAYALGKCQRIICLLREAGYDDTIYLHGAMMALCRLYEELGVKLGALETLEDKSKEHLKGKIIIAPPSALHDRWSRRLPDPVVALASGWMTVRQRAKQKLLELPLVISDHADWDELTQTLQDVEAAKIWVTHGREDALVHYAKATLGLKARPLDLQGYEDEDD
jgi:putative mRNA 3-end processing factor